MNDSHASASPAAAAADTPAVEATEEQKRLALGIISGCHTLNHLQYSVGSVIYPVMMQEMGFGLLQLGFISALSAFVGQGLQVIYGFFTGFFKRTKLLGTGNAVAGAVAMMQCLVHSYPQLLVARVGVDIGSSPQHPLGSSLLSRYYSKARGWALTVHLTAGNLGSFLGPALASIALLYMSWRTAVVIFGLPSVLMGLALLTVRDHTGDSDAPDTGKKKMKANLQAYWQCLHNRNIIFTSLVLMAGAAGRGTGVNVTYLVPFFMERFGVTASAGGFMLTLMQGAGLVGPLAIASLSDRFGHRTLITQGTLLMSAIMTFWLVQHGAVGLLFYANLILYGTFVQARGALTQTMIGDFATPELTDAAFSIYYFVGFISGPVWTLIIGYVMEHYGFTAAFHLAGTTYIAGMLLLLFVKERR
jgi:MFS transporter, FSR family, fosmidomycin resistance protein